MERKEKVKTEITFQVLKISYGSKNPEIQTVLKSFIENKVLKQLHHFSINKGEQTADELRIIDEVIKENELTEGIREYYVIKLDETEDEIKERVKYFKENTTKIGFSTIEQEINEHFVNLNHEDWQTKYKINFIDIRPINI